MSLKDKIAAARAALEQAEPSRVDVELGGEITSITFLPVSGVAWADITATNPPRVGATVDDNVGYNTDAVARVYPLDRVTVDGEQPSDEDWADLLDVLASPSRKAIASVLWGINQLEPAKRLQAAGKASAGSQRKKSS